ncbi:MAG: SRPBCC family protein [Acidimicrobiales bacterium]
MASYASTINVAASPEEAFEFLRDPANRAEWDPSVRHVTPIDHAAARVGDRYEVTVGFYGKAIDAVYEIAELEAPDRIVFSTDGKVKGRDVIEITPRDGGASITLDLRVQMKGAARLLDRGLQVAFAGIGENAANAMKARLDRV